MPHPTLHYDRHLDPRLHALLTPDGPLAWLLPWLHTEQAEASLAHLQFRRDRGSRRYGGIQVYTGRTSPFEVLGTASGFTLRTNRRYAPLDPELFGRPSWSATDLATLEPRLRRLLAEVPASAPTEFLAGEAIVHSGLARSLGPLADAASTYRAIDTEARMAFRDTPTRTAFQQSLPARCGLPDHEQMPQKLDLVAIGSSGALMLVEVKDAPTGLDRAAWQAATHVARFQALLDVQPEWSRTTWSPMVDERHALGLLGTGARPDTPARPAIVPVIAAPDASPTWAQAWRDIVSPIRERAHGTLDALRLWRLGPRGRLLEDLPA